MRLEPAMSNRFFETASTHSKQPYLANLKKIESHHRIDDSFAIVYCLGEFFW